jgi:uncharacterized membrane protein YciS (DUF1049 family)
VRLIKGDSVTPLSSGQKNFFSAIAAAGILLATLIMGILIYLSPQIKDSLEKEIQKMQTQQNAGSQFVPWQKSI